MGQVSRFDYSGGKSETASGVQYPCSCRAYSHVHHLPFGLTVDIRALPRSILLYLVSLDAMNYSLEQHIGFEPMIQDWQTCVLPLY